MCALLIRIDVISENAGLKVVVSGVDSGWLVLGDASSASSQEDQAMDHVVFIE